MRKILLATVLLALPATALAEPSNVAECKSHLAQGVATMTADRFAEELAGAEGRAGAATPTIRGAALMLVDLNARIQDRTAELAALKDQVARIDNISAGLAVLRTKEPGSTHYIDIKAEPSLMTLRDALNTRITTVGVQLTAERTALDQSLQFHCNASATPASAAAH